MSAPLLAGVDLGTSAVKVALFELSGDLVARSAVSYPTMRGPGGVVEQNPEEWWAATRRALQSCGSLDRVAAIGFTGQMQDIILVRDRHPMRAALLYSDMRATDQHRRLTYSLDQWERITGNHQDPSSAVAKLLWLADHEPDTLAEAEHVLLSAPGYIAHRAGGAAACDVTTASTTGLMELRTGQWAQEIVEASGADRRLMPLLLADANPKGDLVGYVEIAAAAELGVAAGTPIVLALGDAAATTDALVGLDVGDAYLYLGSTGWVAHVSETAAQREPSVLHALALPGLQQELLIGAVASAGTASDWARRTFLGGRPFNEVERLLTQRAADLEPHQLPLCLPGLGGERTPVRDSNARGAFVGLTDETDDVDLYLSVLVGVAMNLRHAADMLGLRPRRLPLVGGAAASSVWRQIIADVFDAVVVTRSLEEVGTRSAARSAGDALSLEHGIAALFAQEHHNDATATPSRRSANYAQLLDAHRALFTALSPAFHNMARYRT